MDDQIADAEPEITTREESFGRRFLRIFVRVLLVVILGTVIGVALYLSVPALYRQFIEPVQGNSQRIDALEESLAQMQVNTREQHSAISRDLAEIEGGLASQREDMAEVEAQGEVIVDRLEEYGDDLDELPSLFNRIEDLEDDLGAMGSRLDDLEQALQDEVIPAQYLGRQIQLLRAMELVTRARLWLMQGNLGMAAEDVLAAKEILEVQDVDAMEGGSLTPIIVRLDAILAEIDLRPVIAADDLEVVWQLLLFATAP
jgi:hypothetical protein